MHFSAQISLLNLCAQISLGVWGRGSYVVYDLWVELEAGEGVGKRGGGGV